MWFWCRRAKLYRFASENDPPEWKERGTGDVKLLRHTEKGSIRLLMRRDRTLKICANHLGECSSLPAQLLFIVFQSCWHLSKSLALVMPLMELKPNAGSDRAWVWNTHADFADEKPKPEMLAIRFLNAESEYKSTSFPGEIFGIQSVYCNVLTQWYSPSSSNNQFDILYPFVRFIRLL